MVPGEKTANIESNKLKNCHPIKDLSGEQNSLTGSVTCDSGTIDMKFDVLFKPEINSEINLTLSGDDYSYSELGEANYICHLN